MTDSILVAYTTNKETDTKVLVVGKKRMNQSVKIINAFDGDEAEELWNKLTTAKEKKQ